MYMQSLFFYTHLQIVCSRTSGAASRRSIYASKHVRRLIYANTRTPHTNTHTLSHAPADNSWQYFRRCFLPQQPCRHSQPQFTSCYNGCWGRGHKTFERTCSGIY
jgi:hypothetical protein